MPAPIIAAAGRAAATRAAGGAAARGASSAAARGASAGVRPPALPNRISTPPPLPRGEIRPSARTSASEGGLDEQNPAIIRRKRIQNRIEEEEDGGFDEGGSEGQVVKYRIGKIAMLFLIALGVYLDLLELVIDLAGTLAAGVGVVIGYIKDFFTLFIIPAIFLLLRAPFWKGRKAKKKMVSMVTSFLVSLIPWIGAFLPETTISIAVTIYLTRKEDKEKVEQDVQERVIASTVTRMRRK